MWYFVSITYHIVKIFNVHQTKNCQIILYRSALIIWNITESKEKVEYLKHYG